MYIMHSESSSRNFPFFWLDVNASGHVSSETFFNESVSWHQCLAAQAKHPKTAFVESCHVYMIVKALDLTVLAL